MSATTPFSDAPVFFCYANPTGFSGQKAATELVIKGLIERGKVCRNLTLPVYDRAGGTWRTVWLYLFKLMAAWIRSLQMLREKEGWLYVNLGQTRASFLRDAIPLAIGRLAFGRNRLVASLHSSLFMTWPRGSIDLWIFRRLLGNFGRVTVLGERQRMRLVDLGLPLSCVQVVVNSCELPIAGDELVQAKNGPTGVGGTVRILHLSGLYDAKGYPEYLEALPALAGRAGPVVEAVLCGCLVTSDFSNRFPNRAAAEEWIERQVREINQSVTVRVQWIKGARGAAKQALFQNADIFILPTRYIVEAQPLVLLEAMASGCAIVTTHAGEIDTILDENCAMFLSSVSRETVAEALKALIDDPARRRALAVAAHARYRELYQVNQHIDRWEGLLGGSKAVSRSAVPGLPVPLRMQI